MAANPLPTPPLRLEVQNAPDVATILCHGKLISDTAPELKALVKPLIPVTKRIVLDLSDVQYMDSSALGALVGLYTSAISNSSRLQLVKLSPRVGELLRITKLISIFEPFGEHL